MPLGRGGGGRDKERRRYTPHHAHVGFANPRNYREFWVPYAVDPHVAHVSRNKWDPTKNLSNFLNVSYGLLTQ